MDKQLFLFLLALLLLSTQSILQGAASRVAYVDPFATARGNAFTATADNPSAIFYNSAGLTQIEGTQVQANVFALSGQYDYEFLGTTTDSDNTLQPVPSIFVTHKFKDVPIALGFGIYAPFALGVEWGANSPLAAAGYQSNLAYYKFHPVIAWQVTDTLSIGAGPTFDFATLTLKTTGPLGSYEGEGKALGYSLSVLWQPAKQHSFGINYQAATDMQFNGDSTVLGGGTEADLNFPDSIVVGYSWRPTERWNIEFNLDWTNWERVDSLDIGLFPPSALNWESSFIWELGATHYFDGGWNVSAGYTFVENSVPDATLGPLVPDHDKHFIAAGVGRQYDHFSWQLTGQYGFGNARTVANANSGGFPVKYKLDSFALAFSIGYKL